MMKTRCLLCCLTLFLLIGGLLPGSASAKDEWIKAESKNFHLYGNASEKDIRGVATKLEQFREAFRQIFPKVKYNSAIPTNVIVFKSDKSFKEFKPVDANGKTNNWIAGFFQSGEDVNYIALSTEGEKANTYQTIFHEYVHFLVNNDLGRANIPAWFNEGIAEYYEQFTIENDDKVTLGGLDQNNLLYLQQNKLIPLETFFNIDNYTLHQQGNDGAGIFYAQAWALMHYFMQSSEGARNPQMSKFLNLLLAGKPSKESFTEAFQTDYATMEKELKKYVEQRTFRVSIATFKNKLTFDADLKTAPLSEANAKAILGDLLYHSNRVSEAEAQLQTALTLDADSVPANTTLGLVKARQRNFPEAKKYLEKAVALDDNNYLVQYHYAFALSREGMNANDFVTHYDDALEAKMRQALKKAIALNPDYAESYALYAFVSIVQNRELDEAIQFMNKAHALAPGNQWYQLRIAELYQRKEDFVNARKIAEKVAQTADEPDLRNYAQNVVRAVDSYQAQMERVKKYNSEQTANPRQIFVESDKELSAAEIEALQKKAMFESINEALRKPEGDEKRMLATLSKIECTPKGIFYTVSEGAETVKLTSVDFQSLVLMGYETEVSDLQIGCGTLKKEVFGVITYRPKTDPKNKTAGEIVAVELVPKDFTLAK